MTYDHEAGARALLKAYRSAITLPTEAIVGTLWHAALAEIDRQRAARKELTLADLPDTAPVADEELRPERRKDRMRFIDWLSGRSMLDDIERRFIDCIKERDALRAANDVLSRAPMFGTPTSPPPPTHSNASASQEVGDDPDRRG